ncbi:MAG: nucleotidyltransferase domain-containing protein [Candidatus Woesearchaeota archaeon]
MDKTIQISGFVKKDLLLLSHFLKDPSRAFTISQIKALSRNNSHHYVFSALKRFCSLGLLFESKFGQTNTYTLDFRNLNHLPVFAFVESLVAESKNNIPFRNIEKISEKMGKSFYCLLVYGSYAEQKESKTSDLDIAFIVPDSDVKKQYEIALRAGTLMQPEVHGFVFSEDEFYQMLVNDEFNVGKEIIRNHVILYGGEQYYRLLFKALKHGFKSENLSDKGKK